MGFPRQDNWSTFPFLSPGDLSNSGIKPVSPALAGRFFATEPPGKLKEAVVKLKIHGWVAWARSVRTREGEEGRLQVSFEVGWRQEDQSGKMWEIKGRVKTLLVSDFAARRPVAQRRLEAVRRGERCVGRFTGAQVQVWARDLHICR